MTITGFKTRDLDTAPAGAIDILKSAQKAWESVPNLHRALAASPAEIQVYATLRGIALSQTRSRSRTMLQKLAPTLAGLSGFTLTAILLIMSAHA